MKKLTLAAIVVAAGLGIGGASAQNRLTSPQHAQQDPLFEKYLLSEDALYTKSDVLREIAICGENSNNSFKHCLGLNYLNLGDQLYSLGTGLEKETHTKNQVWAPSKITQYITSARDEYLLGLELLGIDCKKENNVGLKKWVGRSQFRVGYDYLKFEDGSLTDKEKYDKAIIHLKEAQVCDQTLKSEIDQLIIDNPAPKK